MPKRRDLGRSTQSSVKDEADRAPPDREAVERALESIVDRLKPKPPATKPVRKAHRPGEPAQGSWDRVIP